MLVNELLIKKLEMVTCAFMEISVLYSSNETKFVMSLAPDTRSITGNKLFFDKNFTWCIYKALLLSNFTGNCNLEVSNPLASFRESYM